MRDLSEIDAFIQVVRKGGFSAAEKSSGIPKSTLSRKVLSLEKRLKTTLLKRTTRKLSLTTVGELYYQGCSNALSEIDDIEQQAMDSEVKASGVIRLTAPVEVASEVLPELIQKFQSQYPAITFDLDLNDRIVDLVEENFDCALRGGDVKNSSSLIAKKVGFGEFKLYTSQHYLNAHPKLKSASPHHIEELNCHYFNGNGVKEVWELENENGEQLKIKLKISIRSNSLLILKHLTECGSGIALLPRFICQKEEQSKKLIPIFPEWKSQYESFHIVMPKKKYVTPRVKLFSDFLTHELRDKMQI